MKHTFKHLDHSESVQNYAQEKFGHISKYLLKEASWHIFYSKGKVDFEIDVIVYNGEHCFKAKAEATDLYTSIDMAVDKLSKQFLKKKSKIQHHKNYAKSKLGRFERLSEQLEYDPSISAAKKAG